MNKILFKFDNNKNEIFRIGEAIQLFHACYFKAKELGYSDIYIEWPSKIEIDIIFKKYGEYASSRKTKYFKYPETSYLPIKFIRRDDTYEWKYDKVINLLEDNSFFDGCKSLKNRNHDAFVSYLNKYYSDTKIHPEITIEKDDINKPYILFHYRHANYSPVRNSNKSLLINIVDGIKDKYGDRLEYHITGDAFPDVFNEIFDVSHAPYYQDINKLFKLVNNASIVIGGTSSIIDIANMLGIPFIMIGTPRKYGTGKPYSLTKEFWDNMPYKFGTWQLWWLDENKYLIFWKDEHVEMDNVFGFIDRWIK